MRKLDVNKVKDKRSGGCEKPSFVHDCQGFTLIDMCILLLVVGLYMVPTMQLVNIYYINKVSATTNNSLAATDLALEQYYFLNDKYPCPADPTLSEADANYGVAAADCDLPSDPDPAVGGIPFKDLKIPVDSTLDGYKNKITYAVSKGLTETTTFAAGGDLDFQMFNPGTGTNVTAVTTGQFALISHGRNGKGGYSSSGVLIEACPTPPTAELDNENCDNDEVFIFHESNYSTVAGVNFYDDRVQFQEETPIRIWMNSDVDSDDIFSNSGLIGIGANDPEVELDVEGNIRTVGGNANATMLCEEDIAGDCFQPEVIGGTGIACTGGEGMTGIAQADVNCGVAAAGYSGNCGGGVVVGFDAGGNAICAP